MKRRGDTCATLQRPTAGLCRDQGRGLSSPRRTLVHAAPMSKTGRNQPCPCGSTKKYKKCCLNTAQSARLVAAAAPAAIQTLVRQGYAAKMSGDDKGAAEPWWRVWQALVTRLRPDMTCTDAAAREIFDPEPCLYDWLQDLAEALHNAAIDDMEHARRGVRLCRTVIDHFTDEDPLFLRNFRADMGEFLFLAGDDAQGEHVLRHLIETFPRLSLGYVRLADVLEHRARNTASIDDLRLARNLLQQALQSADDADLYDVDHRLRDLQAQLAPITEP